MTIGTGVFVRNEAGALVPMQPMCFLLEDDFQDLLARFPALLAGDQMNGANPRRFVLIDREQPIASELGDPDAGPSITCSLSRMACRRSSKSNQAPIRASADAAGFAQRAASASNVSPVSTRMPHRRSALRSGA